LATLVRVGFSIYSKKDLVYGETENGLSNTLGFQVRNIFGRKFSKFLNGLITFPGIGPWSY